VTKEELEAKSCDDLDAFDRLYKIVVLLEKVGWKGDVIEGVERLVHDVVLRLVEDRIRGEATSGDAPFVAVPCGGPGCNHTTVFPLGTLDPKQGACVHVFVDQGSLLEGIVCRGCGLKIDREVFHALGYVHAGSPYDGRGNAAADENQKLRDENREVLAENGRLRRQLERGKQR
jgi:hypothetical protein